jgi:hypothetical protein
MADIRILAKFVAIFCRERHNLGKQVFSLGGMDIGGVSKREVRLCPECTRLLRYGLSMRLRCPHDPKPMCRKCQTQCYRSEYRERIREVMKFSGMYLVKRGRLDLLLHFLK